MWSSFLLLWSLNDQVHRQPILDPVLIQSVSILQDLPGKDQNQLILFGFKPPGNLFFELKKIKIKKNKQSTRQANGGGQEWEDNAPGIISGPRKWGKEPRALQHLTKKRSPCRQQFSRQLLRRAEAFRKTKKKTTKKAKTSPAPLAGRGAKLRRRRTITSRRAGGFQS